ncbi:MAG TPA: hypothetical protein P5307_03275 [Pirellulaceae bacterium]|nr:hypothetical protein [Pirellulaceae bacterium]
MQYIALIHKNADTSPSSDEWDRFFEIASETGMFKGGSEIDARLTLGRKEVPDTTKSVGGFMRFDSDDINLLFNLLESHPVVRHGGTIELCQMPESQHETTVSCD